MIRRCLNQDLESMQGVINNAAQAYRGVIPEDRWHEPYMPLHELRDEIAAGVVFWGFDMEGKLLGVMGIQHVKDVTLIRHAYVQPEQQRTGIGSKLLRHLLGQSARPMLVGTWADAVWAVHFYEKHGFRLVSDGEKDRLLRAYWTIPDRQIETSVVLADPTWLARHPDQLEEGDIATT